jgi:flagellar motor component MotA
LAIEQPSPSCHGVARPAALSGLAGTASEQFSEAAAWAAVWFRLMAAPVPSTGVVAMSPSVVVAMAPLANELAGGTAAAVPVALGVAVALAVADPLAVGVADALAVG